MIDVGRLCMKIAGRDAGKKCVIVDIIDTTFVLIDGNVRRKRCNINHLELLPDTIELKKGASHEDVLSAFEKLGILPVPEKKHTAKAEAPVEKARPVRKRKVAKAEPSEPKKKAKPKK